MTQDLRETGMDALDAAVEAMLRDVDSDVRKDLRHYGQAFIKVSPDGKAERIDPTALAEPSGKERGGE